MLIAFADGDPDRPIIVGGTYRPGTPSPVTSSNSKQNLNRSESGGGVVMRDA